MKRHLTLRGRVFLIFFGIVMLVIGIFFVMNRFLWRSMYIKENQKALLQTYDELSAMVADAKTTEEDLQEKVKTARLQSITFALEGRTEWGFMPYTQRTVAPYEQDFLLERLQANFLIRDSDGVKVLQQTDNY
ncbi:MAG: hypothetical protein IKR59_09515, partial [Lachnospiraceae bacterium]|nr:hypothetical protein [Lachnospiraceae bacterium]